MRSTKDFQKQLPEDSCLFVYNPPFRQKWKRESPEIIRTVQQHVLAGADIMFWLARTKDQVWAPKSLIPRWFLDYVQQTSGQRPQIVTQRVPTDMDPEESLRVSDDKTLGNVVPFENNQAIELCQRPSIFSRGTGEYGSKVGDYRLFTEVALNLPKHVICERSDQVSPAADILPGDTLVLKEDVSVGGYGVFLLERARVKESASEHAFPLIMEEFLSDAKSFSTQFYVSEQGSELIASSEQRLEDHFYHIGNTWIANPQARSDQREAAVYSKLTQGCLAAAEFMRKRGYRGFVGFDGMVNRSGEVYPAIEINPRMTFLTIPFLVSGLYADAYQHFSSVSILVDTRDAELVRNALDSASSTSSKALLLSAGSITSPIPSDEGDRGRAFILLMSDTPANLDGFESTIRHKLSSFHDA